MNQYKVYTSSEHIVLYLCRLVHSGPTGNNKMGAELTFSTRTGTRNGVECHLFRVERPKELTTWSHALVNGAHHAAALIKEINCGKCDLCMLCSSVVEAG